MNRRLLAGALAFAITATSAVLLAQPAFAQAELTGSFQDLVVDDAHRQAFVGQTDPDAVQVVDFNGDITRTLTGFTKPKDLSISPDGSTVYVAEHDTPSLAVIDTQTYTVDKVALPAEHCVWSTASTGGKLWYSYRDCAGTGTGSLGSYDPATGEITGGTVAIPPGELRALPGRPDRLFQMDNRVNIGTMRVYDVSAGTPVLVSTNTTGSACVDAALFDGGDKVSVACLGQVTYATFNTADLSPVNPHPVKGRVKAVAASPDDRFIATGSIYAPDDSLVSVRNLESGLPVSDHVFGFPNDPLPESLAFTADGSLFVVATDAIAHVDWITVIEAATTPQTSITLDAPATVHPKDAVEVTGALLYGPGPGAAVSVTRSDFNGSQYPLGTVTVGEDGVFSFTDAPGRAVRAVYTATFTGDAEHRFARQTVTVDFRGLTGDVNGDGYADTVVGAPGEDLGADADTGQLHLLYGSATGVTTAGNKTFHQDTANVPGDNEDGDQFGASNAFGDFNGDGYADVAVAASAEDIGSTPNVGEVFVFYGSPSGLKTTGVGGIYPAAVLPGLFFGNAVAAGDFNGDGRDDLAVGTPGTYSGSVFVYPGADSGLSRSRYTEFRQGADSIPGDSAENDLFGWALDAGDVNADGLADLAVGAVYDYEDKGWSTGSVTVIYGGQGGLNQWGHNAQRITKDTPYVPGAPSSFNESKGDHTDEFGNSVVLADFDGDGRDGLAVAAAGAAVTGTDGKRKADAGTVTVLYSDGSNIRGNGSVELTQKTVGMPGNPGAEDAFGATIAAGDANRDGRNDLAVYGAGEDFVTVVPGEFLGLTGTGAKAWDQDSPGVPGGSEAGDQWGYSLRFADTKGNGHLSLIVGAPGEDTGAGAFTVLYATASGITGTGAKFFSQDTAGIPGGEEKSDWFGAFF